MKNAEYWQQRFLMIEEAAHQESEAYLETALQEFRKAERSIQADIERWYGRFATNNEIGLTEAKKWLHGAQLEEFRWTVEEYIKAGESLDPRWLKQLENASARVHISRLESLQLQVQQQIEPLYGGQLDSMDALLRRIYSDGYYHSAFEIQRGWQVGWSLQSLDPKRMETVLSTPWTTDGRTFSNRIWLHKAELLQELRTQLTQALIRGDPASRVVDAVRDRFRVSRGKAARLVHTEQAFFSSRAQMDAFRELDVKQYVIVATLDELTSEICRELDGTVLSIAQYEPGVTAPPFHPNCRTCTAPWFEDNYGERAARNIGGRITYIPTGLKYEEWYRDYVVSQVA